MRAEAVVTLLLILFWMVGMVAYCLAVHREKRKKRMAIRIVRVDGMGGFAAYTAGTVHQRGATTIDFGKKRGLVLLDVEALFDDTCIEAEGGAAVKRTPEEKRRLLIEVLMHEFGHALEDFLDSKFDEGWIEKVTESFKHKEVKP